MGTSTSAAAPPTSRNGRVRPASGPVDVADFLRHPRPSRAERAATGKSLRAAMPLEQHAQPPAPHTRDAVAILHAQEADREPALLPLRYERMSESPFSFLRGSAAVMAADLAAAGNSGITVQLCGDAHVANFGMFAGADRRLLFDLNDFDETLRGPFEWDVKRLAASLAVVGRTIGMKDKATRRAAQASVATYRESMAKLAASRTLDIWYLRVDADDLIKPLAKTALSAAERRASKKARANTGDVAVAKMTEMVRGVRQFKAEPPVLAPIPAGEVENRIGAIYSRYLSTLPLDCALLLARYSFRAAAHRVVGVGSVGTRSLLLLLESGDGEPLLLQMKQAGESVLESHLGPSHLGASHGHRVVAGQRLMQAAGDPFLGGQTATGRCTTTTTCASSAT